MFKPLAALLFAASLTSAAAIAQQLPPQPKVRPAGIPAAYVMASPCIPQMGEHWVNPKDLKAPIYGTYKGKVIFSEIMVPLKTLQAGYNYHNLTALPGHTINHVALEFEPHGHPGMMIPHYDVHAYYISYAQQQAICPAGVTAMKM
jgi:hypothetical protein